MLLPTDLIAVSLGLISALILVFSLARTNTRLERENAWLRSRVRDLRKQVEISVERPF